MSADRTLAGVALILLVGGLSGCVSTTIKEANAVPAAHAEEEIPQSQLLNVNIAVFDPGIPDDPEERDEESIYPGVREAEARYLPFNLREKLEQTGYWGAVRVVPEPIEHSEVLVTGEILESDGMTLKLRIKAVDASGATWIDESYEQETTRYNYSESIPGEQDAFEGLFNQVANDLLAARQALSAKDIRDIQRLSELRFAAEFAPYAFAPYLTQEADRYQLVGLPAEGEPMMARIERIRGRDYAVIDALDQHYRLFHDRLTPTYNNWRSASYSETEKLRELRKQATSRKIIGALGLIGGIIGLTQASGSGGTLVSGAAIAGGAYLYGAGMEKARESKIHAEALEELGRSLESDVNPQIVQLQHQTVTLSGSAEAQYADWQRLLKEIYAAETGFVSGSETAPTADEP